MGSEETLAKMMCRTSGWRRLEHWADVLLIYALCLEKIEAKVDPHQMNGLFNTGADFFRTTERTEAFRNDAGSPAAACGPDERIERRRQV